MKNLFTRQAGMSKTERFLYEVGRPGSEIEKEVGVLENSDLNSLKAEILGKNPLDVATEKIQSSMGELIKMLEDDNPDKNKVEAEKSKIISALVNWPRDFPIDSAWDKLDNSGNFVETHGIFDEEAYGNQIDEIKTQSAKGIMESIANQIKLGRTTYQGIRERQMEALIVNLNKENQLKPLSIWDEITYEKLPSDVRRGLDKKKYNSVIRQLKMKDRSLDNRELYRRNSQTSVELKTLSGLVESVIASNEVKTPTESVEEAPGIKGAIKEEEGDLAVSQDTFMETDKYISQTDEEIRKRFGSSFDTFSIG